MPSRFLAVTIITLWAAMTGWLLYREWSQRYGSPPTMLSALEAATTEGFAEVTWHIYGNNQEVGAARTQVHLEQGQHNLTQKVRLDIRKVGELPLFRLFGSMLSNSPFEELEMKAETRINNFGDLYSFSLRITLPQPKSLRLAERNANKDQESQEPPAPLAQFDLAGKPRADGALEAKLTASLAGNSIPLGPPFDRPYLLPYKGKDIALGSFCPLDRMPDLRPGQTWETPVSDPGALIMFGVPGGDSGVLAKLMDRQPARVQVLPQPEVLNWFGDQASCWVVVTDQDNLHLRIWVRQDNGLILKQTAEWGETKIDIIRDKVVAVN